jgi:hypothetical protein
MKSKINKLRLWLAQRVAPAGADVHDPDDTCCPRDRGVLEAVMYGWVRKEANDTTWMDATDLVDDAIAADLVVERHGDFTLTPHGERELARLWGPGRVAPSAGSYGECHAHEMLYEQFPGDVVGCPHCRSEQAYSAALEDLTAEPSSWWSRSRLPRALR